MNNTLRLRHITCVCLLAIFAIGLTVKDAFATHFRYGNITWTIQNPAQPRVVTIRFTGSFRWSYGWGTPGSTCPAALGSVTASCPPVGTVITASGSFPGAITFSTGVMVGSATVTRTSIPATITVTSINQAEDWLTGTFETTVTIPGTVTDVTVTYNNCCRISSLQDNNHDIDYNVQSLITLRNPVNQPPTAATLPIIRVAAGQTTQFAIPAVDPDGDAITYRFATTAESSLATPKPSGMTIDQTTGLVTYVAPALPVGQTSQLHAVQIVATDTKGAYTVVDLLVERRTVTGQPPVVRINGDTAAGLISTLRNKPVTFTVSASDPENTPVLLVGTGLPIGAVLTPSLPVTQVNPSTTFSWTPTAPGTFVINFSGLDGDGRQAANSMTVNVANATVAAPTTTTVSVVPAVALPSQSITITATVDSGTAGPPPGSLQFFVDGVLATTQQVTAAPGSKATASFTPTVSLGNHTVTATYVGATANDTLYETSTSAPVSFTVAQKVDTAITLSDLVNPTVVGQTVTLTAIVSPANGATATPVGTVVFDSNTGPLGSVTLVNGSATFTTTSLSIGTHLFQAIYQGSAQFNTSGSAVVSHVVNKSASTLSLTPNMTTAPYGQVVLVQAAVQTVVPQAGQPMGTVQFLIDGTNWQDPKGIPASPLTVTLALNGLPAWLAAGPHTISATYSGDVNHLPATSPPQTLTITPDPVTFTPLSLSAATVVQGDVVSASATITSTHGQPVSGQVLITVDGISLTPVPVVNGVVQFPVTSSLLTSGPHEVRVQFQSTNFQGVAFDPVVFTVVPAVSFSRPFTLPDGACICTPLLRGDHRWFVKALGGQSLVISSVGGTVIVHDATGALADSVIVNPAPGAIFQVDATDTDPYSLRFEGAEAAGVSTWLSQTLNEVSATQTTTWYFNTAPGEPFQATLNSTEPLLYKLTNPANTTVSGTATGSTAISGAAVPNGGTWTLVVQGTGSAAAFLSFVTQNSAGDRGAYLAWDSAGEGSMRLTVLGEGSAFSGPVTFTIVGPKGFSDMRTTSNGELSLTGLPTGKYQVTLQVPPGWSALTSVFPLNVLCGEETRQSVELEDTTPPVLTLPTNTTLEATSAAGATYAFTATATDVGGPAVTVICIPPSGATFPIGTTAVACSATDAAGNGATGGFTVTVRDTTPPSIAPIGDITATATSTSGASVTFAASAIDAVTASPLITYSHAPGSTFPIGTTTVTVTAKDAAGNAATRTFTVTVAPLPYSANARVRLRHGPTINSARINGSMWVMLPEDVTLNGNATITGDLILPGTPQVTRNGTTTLGAIVDGFGAATPTNHRLTLNGGASLGRLVRRIDGVTLTPVAAPPAPQGTRNVQLNGPADNPGSFATIRDLTLNGNVGTIAVPGGTYGTFTANGNNVLRLGIAGATSPTVYNFQQLVLNGNSRLEVVGPVIVTVRQNIQANGSMGNASQPDWLELRVSDGGLTLNGSVSVYAVVVAPSGEVVVNGGTKLVGRITADRLTLNGGALLDLVVPFP